MPTNAYIIGAFSGGLLVWYMSGNFIQAFITSCATVGLGVLIGKMGWWFHA